MATEYKTNTKPVEVGNIVYFHFAAKLGAKASVAPAIVTHVNDDETVNLTVFNDSLANTFEAHVKEGLDGWGWPKLEPKPEPKPEPVAVEAAKPPME